MMPPDVLRNTLDERGELHRRLITLTTFLTSAAAPQTVDADEIERLHHQHSHMSEYLAVLDARLEAGGYNKPTDGTDTPSIEATPTPAPPPVENDEAAPTPSPVEVDAVLNGDPDRL